MFSFLFPHFIGSLAAAAALGYGWGWSFAVPGLIIAFLGFSVFLFLPVSPESVGVDCQVDEGVAEQLLGGRKEVEEKAVGFVETWKIPGVASCNICPLVSSFSKLFVYTFLYWLPFYISRTTIDGKCLSDEMARNLSTLFDVGGIVVGILAGHVSDRLNLRAITATSFMYCTIPPLFFYRIYGDVSVYVNLALMFEARMFVNGTNSLITTAVSANLGTQLAQW